MLFFSSAIRAILSLHCDGILCFWGPIPRAPNFAEIHTRGGGGRLAVMPRDSIPPWGHELLHGEARKPTKVVEVAQLVGVPWRTVVRRRARPQRGLAGGFRRGAGRKRRAAGRGCGCGGKSWRARGKKPHTWAVAWVHGVRGTPGSGRAPGFFRASRAPSGRFSGVGRAFGWKKGGVGGAGGQKAPLFLPQTGRAARVSAAELAVNAGGVCRVTEQHPLLFSAFGGKKLGASEKPFRARHKGESQVLCKPSMWCRIEAPQRRF